jgi:hypothetical protein
LRRLSLIAIDPGLASARSLDARLVEWPIGVILDLLLTGLYRTHDHFVDLSADAHLEIYPFVRATA